METNALLFYEVTILPLSDLTPEMADEEILKKSKNFLPEKAVPGSIIFSTDGKPSVSGQPYSINVSYTLPFALEEKDSGYLLAGVGAIVLKDLNDRHLVLHKNDWVQNTPPRATLAIGITKTVVSFSMSTLSLNFL